MKSSPNNDVINQHPLMHNNITKDDIETLINYLQSEDPQLTQGSNVKAFEKEWSEWLGVEHSVYVNSGSSANLITMAVLKELCGTGEIIVPPLTWVSDIAAVLQNGFLPVFADVNRQTLSLDTDRILEKVGELTKAVFITHAQGFNGLTTRLIEELNQQNIYLIEDVCEAHGAMHADNYLGTYGLMSNFSFYYAHHMSTIEGGMVCTNSEEIEQLLRMYRSHGMVREATNSHVRDKYATENPSLNPDFIFAFAAYNVRNTEIGAVIGRNQLKRLVANNESRNRNHELFLSCLDKKRFWTEFCLEGCSNYAFNVVLNKPDFNLRDRLEVKMREASIEFRRGSSGGGNQMRQPYLDSIVDINSWEKYPVVEHIHNFGWYIGNYPDLAEDQIRHLCAMLNNA